MLIASAVLLALAAAASPGSDSHAPEIDCKAERIALLKSLKPIAYPDAKPDAKEDADPLTLELFYVTGLSAGDAHVSSNGQCIYLPPSEDPTLGTRLFASAIDHILALKVGPGACPPIRVPAHGT